MGFEMVFKNNPPRVVVHLLLTAYCLLLIACNGCAVLAPITQRVPAVKPSAHVPLDDGYEEYTGVIHIHTQYSDGGGTFEDVARVANQQQLDYLIVTDHNTLRPLRDGKQGWYGMTLVLVGKEISTRGGHYLAMNIREEVDRRQPTQAIIDEVNRQGGLGFIAHPYFKKRRWTDWTVQGVVGIEAYNVAHDSLDENRWRIALWSVAVTADPLFLSMLDRPYDPLATWDEMIRRRGRIVGIGSSDAHEVRVFGLKIAPYDIMFKLIRTHLLTRNPVLSEADVYDALRNGHSFFSMDLVADATGFSFLAEVDEHVVGIMGDEIPFVPNLHLMATLPSSAQLELFRDGRSIATTTGQHWHVPIQEPGAYRLEACRYRKPWIFSNPIYIRPPAVEAPHETLDSQPQLGNDTAQHP